MKANKQPGFIFGGDTGMSYEQLQKKRAVAKALMANNASRAPRNVGEGLHSFGNAIAAALINKRADKRQGELDAQWSETVGGLGLDPARLALVENMPYNQRNAYLLSHMDRQEALKRKGSGTGKADAQAAIVAALLGDSGGNAPSPQAAPSAAPSQNDFFNGNGSVGGVGSFGSLPRPQAPQGQQAAAPTPPGAPVISTSGTFDDSRSYQTASNRPLAEEYAGLNMTPSLVSQPQQPQQPPTIGESGYKSLLPVGLEQAMMGVSGEARPELGFNLETPAPTAPQEAPPVDVRSQLTSEINGLYSKLGSATDASTQRAILTAIDMKSDQLKFIPEADKGTSSQQDYQFYLDDEKARGNPNPMSFQEWSISDEVAGNPSAPDVNKTRTDYQRYPVKNAAGEVTGYRETVTPGSETHRTLVRDRDVAISKGAQSIALLDSIINDPALASITGMFQGNLPPMTQAGTDLNVKIKQVQGKAFLEAFDSLKGAGQITEIEGTKATEAMARLDRAQSHEAYVKALNELKQVVSTGVERARRGVTVDALGRETEFGTRPSLDGAGSGSGAAPGGVATHKFNAATGKIEEVSQ